MGVDTSPTNPKLNPALHDAPTAQPGEVRQPDQEYFHALQTEVNDKGFLLTSTEDLFQWARTGSLWWMTFGLACCAVEMIHVNMPRYDMERFGVAPRASPRQSDLMIVAGWCSHKMAHTVRRIWDQMAEPKWVISMGACASTGGVFDTYAVVQGVDQFIPVDVYVPGCPPNPEQLMAGLMRLQEKMRAQQRGDWVEARSGRHGAAQRFGTENQTIENKAGRKDDPGLEAPARSEIAVKLHIKRKQQDHRNDDLGNDAKHRIVDHCRTPSFPGRLRRRSPSSASTPTPAVKMTASSPRVS